MEQIKRRKSKYTAEKVTKSESEAGVGERGYYNLQMRGQGDMWVLLRKDHRY